MTEQITKRWAGQRNSAPGKPTSILTISQKTSTAFAATELPHSTARAWPGKEITVATPTRESTDAELARLYLERDELQQRLTAADERADVLEGLLNLAQGHIGDASLSRDIDAALKPTEGGGDEG